MNGIKILVRIAVSALAYVVGMAIMGMLMPVLHLPTLKPLPGMNQEHAGLLLLVSSPLLIVGLLPLAAYLKGTWMQRCLAIAALIYVTLGLNTLIEAKIFTGILDGSPWLASVQFVLPALMTGAALTYHFGGSQDPIDLGAFKLFGWRVVVAWLAFPVIYFVFGMCVAPFVVPYYTGAGGALGLKIPAFSIIIKTQLLRSAIFLAASLPAIVLWTKSRGKLILALGLAHAMTVGIFQLAQATFLPVTLRVAHSIEITFDSFSYAAVLVLLLVPRAKIPKPAIQGTAAAAD